MSSAGKRPRARSPLIEAAEAFDDELTSYLNLSEAFVRAPLTSSKQLERVNDLLGQIAASEQKLAACGQRLAEAVSGARERQEQQARQLLDRLPEVKERMQHLHALLSQFEQLGVRAAGLNQTAAGLGRRAPDDAAPIAGARELATEMQALAAGAAELATAAKQADFQELAGKAHALHQQLLSAHHKLKLAVLG